MKPEKSSPLKKIAKKVTKTVKAGGAAVARAIKKAVEPAPETTPAPKPVKPAIEEPVMAKAPAKKAKSAATSPPVPAPPPTPVPAPARAPAPVAPKPVSKVKAVSKPDVSIAAPAKIEKPAPAFKPAATPSTRPKAEKPQPAVQPVEKTVAKPAPVVAAAATGKPKRKTPAKTPVKKPEVLVVPPILLEGDQPSTPPPVSGPGKRYELGAVPPPAHFADIDTAAQLPEAYDTGSLMLAARDPYWLYVHWDLTRERQKEFNALSADHHLVIRVFIDVIEGGPFQEVHVHPESRHWFVHVGRAGTKFLAQLGYHDSKGRWIAITNSGATITPPDTMSEELLAQFATIPPEVPFEQVVELAQEVVKHEIPLVEVVLQLAEAGFPEFAQQHAQSQEPPQAFHALADGTAPAPPESDASPVVATDFGSAIADRHWTPEKQEALASIITMDTERRVWMGSLEITELIRRQLKQEISSQAAAEFSQPGPGAPAPELGTISSITNITSPFGGMPARKDFWFKVNAELIIYGSTEPDAHVTIGGRTIKLRRDGSFSYRFALPDGTYNLPAVAVSADQSDARAADLTFSRATEYRGDVGAHAQDPQLKAPLVANVA